MEELKKRSDVKFDFLENSKLDVDESISQGGCRMSSNYGQIDATVEQRVEKVWSVINENLPSEVGLVTEIEEEKDSKPEEDED